ncbi:MAG TPA: hypothetical protein V6D19_00540 [Stenomitos sp.]
MLALCDCNSFYASCKVVFAPHLQGKPVIVLSRTYPTNIKLTPLNRKL